MAAAMTGDDGDRDLASSDAGDYYYNDRDPKRKEEASTSEDEAVAALKKRMKKKGHSLFKEGEMLKLRKELWEAQHLWRMKDVPGALDGYLKRKTTTHQVPAAIAAKKKKKKVVRVMLPDGHIDYIKANPRGMMTELSDQEMAEYPERFRQAYRISKFVNAKNRAYKQAIIDQYQAFGFAYDEDEVTDDDDEKEEAAAVVVKK